MTISFRQIFTKNLSATFALIFCLMASKTHAQSLTVFEARQFCPTFAQDFDQNHDGSVESIELEATRLTDSNLSIVLEHTPEPGFPSLSEMANAQDVSLINEYLRQFDGMTLNLSKIVSSCVMLQNLSALQNSQELYELAYLFRFDASHAPTYFHLRFLRDRIHDLMAEGIWRSHALLTAKSALAASRFPWRQIHRFLPDNDIYDSVRRFTPTARGDAELDTYLQSLQATLSSLLTLQTELDDALTESTGETTVLRSLDYASFAERLEALKPPLEAQINFELR